MHEYALTQGIIETAEKHAGGARVSAIALVVGGASGVSSESLTMYFDLLAEGTACAGARLDMEYVAPLLRCVACGALFERKPFMFECACGGMGYPTDTGKEFYIKHIEVVDIT